MAERQRIVVTGGGITVTSVSGPRLSAFGNVIHPGGVHEYELPWDEISVVSFRTVTWVPGEAPVQELTVDLTWGEFFEFSGDTEGFTEAVGELCRRSGTEIPGDTDGVEIWPGG